MWMCDVPLRKHYLLKTVGSRTRLTALPLRVAHISVTTNYLKWTTQFVLLSGSLPFCFAFSVLEIPEPSVHLESSFSVSTAQKVGKLFFVYFALSFNYVRLSTSDLGCWPDEWIGITIWQKKDHLRYFHMYKCTNLHSMLLVKTCWTVNTLN